MTSSQFFKIYEILTKHFNNAEEAKIVVQEIERVVEDKFQEKKEILATKSDLSGMRIDLIDRIHKAKIETIISIVGVAILQTLAVILLQS